MNTDLPAFYSDLFESLHPFTVGFEDVFNRIEKTFPVAKGVSYPPYNVRKENDNHYVVELAVAGFGKNDIDITMDGGTLTIAGKVQSETEDKNDNYLFRGIAARAFKRSFSLADTVEIKNAQLVNGMLKVYLENQVQLTKAAKKIPITNGDATGETKDSRQLLNEGNGG